MSFRKILLSSLFFMAYWAIAFAQTVTLHGTVTNEENIPQEDIVILASAYFADSTVVMITMTTDGNGMYDGAIDSPGPNIYGWLEVSMVDCWGTTITQNFEILTGSEDFTADFNYCQDFLMDSCLVIILEEWNPGNVLELVAWNPLGQEAEYLWTPGGETTESIFPQESGTYCVEATFPWGCAWTDCIEVVVDSNDVCFVFIATTQENDSTWTLEANHSGVGPIEYIWSTGETTQTISNVGPGTYCVTAYDAEGCEDATCIIIDDFSFCEVYIWENPNGGLVAEGFGEPPVSYLWSTGDSTQTIFPSENGLYCVTATDVNGCSAESCYQYYPSPDSCYVYINPIIQDSSVLVLEAIGFTGGESWLYEWSTGETTQTIIPSGNEETYCVTLTDSDGCVASACFDYADYCYSWVSVEYLDTNTAILSVMIDPIFQYPGAPPVSYLWQTGDTDPILTVTESGEYCVTVTIGNDCITESCAYVDFDSLGMACSVWVYSYPDSMGNWVAEATAWGLGDFEYEWTNGETTPVIDLEFPGQFACVTVTSSYGCEAVACVDSIMQICGGYIDVSYQNGVAFLTANVWSFEDGIELLWSTGETGYTIQTQEEGTYCVTINTANCIYTTCAEVEFWSPDSCGVWISHEVNPAPVEYTANPWGQAPFSYLWSNGDTSQIIIIDFGDPNPCVTVTDATGCMSSACAFPTDSCDIYIYYSDQPVPSLHIGSSEPVVSVIWSTGDSTEWLEISEPGTYCADVTTMFGCFATVCYTVDSIPEGLQDIIEGVVFVDSLTQAQGWVTFYAFNPNSGEPFTAVDSVPIAPNGHYASSELPGGVYIAKAVLTPGTNAAEEFMPTYHYASTTWQKALPIGLPGLAYNHDIFMIPTNGGLNGGGVIAGFVTDGQGIVANEDEEVRGNLAGIPNVEIIISNAQGEPLDYAWSMEDGAYIFENLPWGTYRISYDVAGLTSPDIWVTLSPENPKRLQVNVIIEGESVAVKDLTLEELRIYPNPAKEEVHIPVPGTNASYQLQLVDMQGKIIKSGSVINDNGVISIDVRTFAPGLYHINLNGDQVIYYGRFIKQD